MEREKIHLPIKDATTGLLTRNSMHMGPLK